MLLNYGNQSVGPVWQSTLKTVSHSFFLPTQTFELLILDTGNFLQKTLGSIVGCGRRKDTLLLRGGSGHALTGRGQWTAMLNIAWTSLGGGDHGGRLLNGGRGSQPPMRTAPASSLSPCQIIGWVSSAASTQRPTDDTKSQQKRDAVRMKHNKQKV